MLQISPQRSVSGLNSISRCGSRSVTSVVQQHAHRRGRAAVDDELHAAVAQHRPVGQRVAELHLRVRRFAGGFGHDHKRVTGKKIRSGSKHGASGSCRKELEDL